MVTSLDLLVASCLVLVGVSNGLHPVDHGLMSEEELHTHYGTIPIDDSSRFDLVDISDDFKDNSNGEVAFHAFGEQYRARLEENRYLVRPGLHVERWGKEGFISSRPVQKGCYYHGKVVTSNSSNVALNKCDKTMEGIMSLDGYDLHIKPLAKNHAERYQRRFRRDAQNLHMIHKRDAFNVANPNSEFCSTASPRDSIAGMPQQFPAVQEDGNVQSRATQKYMELLVVADNQMRLYHKENVEPYVLMLLNIVASRFVDPSLGQNIRLHVVKFYELHDESVGTSRDEFPQEGGFTVTDDGYQLLKDFCEWQTVLYDQETTDHWDQAIFITRYDIYAPGAETKGLAGRAMVGGTCDKNRQCSINEDNGLGAGLTIAHETGHNLGVEHDAAGGCDDGVNIMSAIGATGEGSFEWSTCSKDEIQTFLSSRASSCLNNDPMTDARPVNMLPGTTYSYQDQCELKNKGYSAVEQKDIDCGTLKCKDVESGGTWIRTFGVPVMEGTPCADRKWCISGKCVENLGLPDPIDSGWSEWNTELGPCSRTCGRGVQQRTRSCNNPTPMYGGKFCTGDAVQYQVCNFQPCDKSQDDFRDKQCAATNDEPTGGGQYYSWVGYIDGLAGDELCDHTCSSAPDENGRYTRGSRAPYRFIDGTQCWDDEEADVKIIKLCVAGTCRAFGCDGKSNSNLEFDVCGVCGGDGSSCQMVDGTFNGGESQGFVTALTVPVGSTFLRVKNTNIQLTYITATVNGVRLYSHNGDYFPSKGRYSAGNMIIRYDPRNGGEQTLTVNGPTSEVIEIEAYLGYDPTLRYVGDVNVRPMISYTYYSPESSETGGRWQVDDYTACSVTCGGGTQRRVVTCVRDGSPIDESECVDTPKPTTSQRCNDEPCPTEVTYKWEATEWGECSTTCGNGVQRRTVMCVTTERSDDDEANDEKCDAEEKPRAEKACNLEPCPDEPEPTACNSLSTAETGTITRLGSTPTTEKCTNVIVAPPGKAIVITINLVNIDCQEYIIVRGMDRVVSLCGNVVPDKKLVMESNIVSIEHQSTQQQEHGFEATYYFTDSSTPASDCDQVINVVETGVLQSPNYPNNYPSDARCRIILVVPPGNNIQLNFRGFRLEDENADGYCYDSLQVVDYLTDGPKSTVYCGWQEQMKWPSQTNIVVLNFSSDPSEEYKGYKIKYNLL